MRVDSGWVVAMTPFVVREKATPEKASSFLFREKFYAAATELPKLTQLRIA
ncbi:MAG: hypothetical protein RIQ93_569 [Verrucomicrobiota bacterium]|jgi:hypothetical protein